MSLFISSERQMQLYMQPAHDSPEENPSENGNQSVGIVACVSKQL